MVVRRKASLKEGDGGGGCVTATSETSFGSLVAELKSPTSSVGKLNRTKEWQEGYEASRRGVIRSRNPYGYPATTSEAEEWQDGWITKFHGECI